MQNHVLSYVHLVIEIKIFLQQTNKLQAVTLWFNQASDWSEHNKHSRHILGVHGFCCFIVNMDLLSNLFSLLHVDVSFCPQLILTERGWFRNKVTVLHEGEGSIRTIKWRSTLIAWANDAVS